MQINFQDFFLFVIFLLPWKMYKNLLRLVAMWADKDDSEKKWTKKKAHEYQKTIHHVKRILIIPWIFLLLKIIRVRITSLFYPFVRSEVDILVVCSKIPIKEEVTYRDLYTFPGVLDRYDTFLDRFAKSFQPWNEIGNDQK